jgi:RNA polymerase sigma factor (sigma-70 family)
VSDFRSPGYYLAVKGQTDSQLLAAYAEQRSEWAFGELVRRYVDLVYSAALRTCGDHHLAEDVTQRTFLALAKSAGDLASRPVLSGWLHRTAHNIASESIRTEVRRRARENHAADMNSTPDLAGDRWDEIAPYLDNAVSALSDADRDAVLLRYFHNRSAREMAAALGVSDEAAQKRLNRAVERLRAFFAERGIALGAVGLGAISANAVQAAPAALAMTVSTAVGTAAIGGAIAAATTPSLALQALHFMNTKCIITALVTALGIGGTVYFKQKADRLRVENTNLLALQAAAQQGRDDEIASDSATKAELDRLRNDQSELLRLRAEVTQLRTAADKKGKQEQAFSTANRAARPRGEYISKEAIAPAGYDTPEAALQTMTWALMAGTYEQADEALAPDLLAADPPNDKEKAAFEERRKASVPLFRGMQIMAAKEVSDDRVEFKVKMDADFPTAGGAPQEKPDYVIQPMAKIGNEWKLGGSTHQWNEAWEKEGNVTTYAK